MARIKHCAWCGKPFTPNNPQEMFCSQECCARSIRNAEGRGHDRQPDLPLPMPPGKHAEEEDWRWFFAALFYRKRLPREWYA